MKIGKRTQAYFVGFLIGLAIVSVLIDSRRDRALENQPAEFTWKRESATLADLPATIVTATGTQGYVTGIAQYDQLGEPTGLKGYFFANSEGKRFWYYGTAGDLKLFDGERLSATSQPGLEWDLMRDGFEHQGHKVISKRTLAPEYLLEIEVHSATEMVNAYENLRSKSNYVAEVGWVAIEESSNDTRD